ncbi:MAG: PAS domain-containing protein [Anaerolineaceae bacterium]|nr:PAS domain-containing protein [Anaerolineaceae bacterium]
MHDIDKTQSQLLDEIAILRERVVELENAEVRLIERQSRLKHLLEVRAGELAAAHETLCQETTRREQAETALQEGENLYRRFFEHSPISLWEEDFTKVKANLDNLQAQHGHDLRAYLMSHPESVAHLAGLVRVLNVNQATLDLLGLKDKSEVLGALKLTDEALIAFREEILAFAEGLTRHESESVGVSPTGEPQHVLFGISIVPGYEDTWAKVLVSALDITERKQAEEALIRERNLMRTMIDHMPDSIYVTDIEGRYLLANRTFLQRRGLESPEALFGKTVHDFMPRESAASFFEEDQVVMRTGQAIINQEIQIPSQTDAPWRSLTKVPWRNEHDEVSGLVIISRDITESKRMASEQLAFAVEREKMAILAKFIEDVSHEFKTPLSIINTKLYLLGKNPTPEKQVNLLASLESQASYIGELVEAMLTMAQLDSHAGLMMGHISWNNLLRGVKVRLGSQAEAKQISLTLTLDDDLPNIQGHCEILHRALTNIVENAIQYTPAGGMVALHAYLDTDCEHAVIEVVDSGIGISADNLPYIFDRFYRVDKARTERNIGLGLSIAKKIIETHGGWIEVKSVFGEGSTIRILLPITGTQP